MSRFDKPSVDLALRVNIALGGVAICFFILVLRLWYLQIVQGDYFRSLSENNRIRTVYVPAPRGLITDRNGETLVKNRPSFNIELVPEDCPDVPGTIARLEELLGQSPGSLKEFSVAQRKRRPFEPKLVMRDISRDVLAKVVARKYELPGIIIGVVPARDYVYGDTAAHVLGYIREITREQLADPRYARYLQGDVVGQYGLEAKLEDRLQGTRGLQRVEVNAMGTRISEYSFESERIGHDIVLSIDLETQKAADLALKDQKGAVVALDPNSGGVIALASSPRFDPNVFTGDLSPELWRDLVSGPGKKLSNRGMQGEFPPGSTFKIFMAIAALSEGVVTPSEKIFCPGYLHFAGRNYGCHKRSGHGYVDLHDAIVKSCDVYFYTVGQRLGVDRIHDYSTRFGLGTTTGLELVYERPGLIPSTEWKRKYFRKEEDKKWYAGETLSVAIGQGAVTVTPLQLARSLAAVVNGGRLLKPYIVERVVSGDGRLLDKHEPVEVGKVDIDPKIIKLVERAMVGVVNDVGGTGGRSKLETFKDILVGGKTGTAQVVALSVSQKADHHEDHAWFMAYAPADKPELVVVALIENGGHGGVAAAPVARQVFEAYFKATRGVPPTEENTAPSVIPKKEALADVVD